MGGDVLPAQLLVEGVETSTGALPIIEGGKYVKATGSNKGHAIGSRMVVATNLTHNQQVRDDVKKKKKDS
jgi:hypothetical protein